MEYALMALRLISQQPTGALVTAKEIADQVHIPFEVVARVLQALSSRGLLRAEYGAGGGYQLSRPLHEVSIYDLNEMLEGHLTLAKCLALNEPCEIARTCNIVTPIINLNNKVKDFYKSVSLQEVLYV